MSAFRSIVCRLWIRALRRRSHKGRTMSWKRFARLIDTWIPKVRIMHPYPSQRLCVGFKVRAV
jgi:RNA-directed DNA polymerase